MTDLRRERIGNLTLLQHPEEFRLTRDALDLTAFATVHPGDRVCDLGCGVGNLLIPLAGRAPELTLDGVELRQQAAQICRRNLEENGLSGTIVTGDLNQRHPELTEGRYDLVVANPPYFPAGTGAASESEARRMARTEGEYTLESACAAAARLLRTGGAFALCIRPDRLAQLMELMRRCGVEPKRLQLRQPRPEAVPNLALVEGRRNGRPGLQVLPVKISL